MVAVAGVFTTPSRLSFQGLLNMSMYFTIWTNVAAVGLFAAALMSGRRSQQPGSVLSRLFLYLTISLVLVCVAYWALLAPTSTSSLWTFSNLTTHLVTPLLLIVYYFKYFRPGAIRHKDVYLSALFPLAYLGAVFIGYLAGYTYGSRQDLFPYFFLDYRTIGWGWVGIYIAAICGIVIGTAYLIRHSDRHRARTLALAGSR